MTTAGRETLSASQDAELARILDAYLADLEAGRPTDPERLIGANPELADRLRRFLEGLQFIEQAGSALPGAEGTEPPGRLLGDFRILREIGRGGMGVVYEAEQVSLRRRVALKILPFAAAFDPRQLHRFQLEAHAAASLHHTNIVPIHAVGRERGVPFYAMQFIQGRSLAELIAELKRAEGLDAPGTGLAEVSTSTLALRLLSGRAAHPGPESAASPVPESDATSGEGSLLQPSPLAGEGGRAAAGRGGQAQVMARASSTADRPPLPNPLPPGGRGPEPIATPGKSQSGWSIRTRDYIRTIAQIGVQAAEALDHAHTHGILHRDIKPANLMLDDDGRLWVTDFGLAQIQGDNRLTLTGDVLGTLRYMSPEQALAKRVVIDGRTDIYSVGVTLYELLALQPAIDGKDRAEILRNIANVEPSPLRRLNPAVPRDLETIIHKAMAKEPSGRYATARELADDLHRWLNHEPIRARRPGPLERAAKWSRRHTAVVASAAIVLVLTTIGLAVGLALLAMKQREVVANRDRADDQRRRAEANYGLARDAVDQMLTEVGQKTLADVPQVEPVRRALLAKALAFNQRLLAQKEDDPAVRLEVARAFARVGKIQRDLGDNAAADEAYAQAIGRFGALMAELPDDPVPPRELAVSLRQQAQLLMFTGRSNDAERALRRAQDLLQAPATPGRETPEDREVLAEVKGNLAYVFLETRRLDEAEASFRESLQIREELATAFPDSPKYQSSLGAALNNLAQMLAFDRGDFAAARPLLERAVACQRAALQSDPYNATYREFARNHHEVLAITLHELGQADEARKALREAIDAGKALVNQFPFTPRYRRDLAGSHGNLANMLRLDGRMPEAEQADHEALTLFEALIAEYPDVSQYRDEYGMASQDHGKVLRNQGRFADAEQAFLQSVEAYETLLAKEPDHPGYRRRLAEYRLSLARLLVTCPDPQFREPSRAVTLAESAVELEPQEANSWFVLGVAHYRAGDWDSAIRALDEAIRLGTSDARPAFFLAMAHWQRGDHEEARGWYTEAIARLAKMDTKDVDEELPSFRAETEVVLGQDEVGMPNGVSVFAP